ncbi:hypothetical protein K1T71_007993 [Dendrolimus kikuchii]|uniref:Uncharacterized protein n=1 Tax=Dendrolimus kikuchii TaxID=765133 RepID=A0ACC1CZA3_9NEOP|nr:hypothetical protein K1T71_007993 [Dendrolimus kikuchii]
MSESKLKDLVKKRGSIKSKVTQFASYLNTLVNSDNISELQHKELECRLSKIDAVYNEFDVLQTEIETLSESPESAFLDRETFDSNYFRLVSEASILLNQSRRRSSAASDDERISLLQTKTKWTHSSGKLEVGSLVLMKDRSQPPLLWLVGRVVKLYQGGDSVNRVAEIKTKRGNIVRVYNNICPLPSLS